MPASSAAPAAAAPVEAEAAEEKPKEKTIFTVKLDAIDAATKAKVIREVKVLMPNMTLVEVSDSFCPKFQCYGCGGRLGSLEICYSKRYTKISGERSVEEYCYRHGVERV